MLTYPDRCSFGILVWQFLLAYAGPTTNVRVEHASLDCFRNGNAVDEVISLCKDLTARDQVEVEVAEEGMSFLTVHVWYLIS